MAFENAPGDLILGDPNGAHIELLSSVGKIVLYSDANTPLIELDATATFFGSPFSRILMRNAEGNAKLQIDQFQVAAFGDTGSIIRMVPGDLAGQNPRLEIKPPWVDDQMNTGYVVAESTPGEASGYLTVQSPYVTGQTPATLQMFSTGTGIVPTSRIALTSDVVRISGDTAIDGELTTGGKLIPGSTASSYVDVGPTTSTTTASITYADVPGVSPFNIVKRFSSARTNLRVRLNIQIRASAACSVRFAANVGTSGVAGSDLSLGKHQIDVANVARNITIERDITGLGAGTRTIQLRWRVNAAVAGPTLTFDDLYSCSVTVDEVSV